MVAFASVPRPFGIFRPNVVPTNSRETRGLGKVVAPAEGTFLWATTEHALATLMFSLRIVGFVPKCFAL